jgi:hypothetical protein
MYIFELFQKQESVSQFDRNWKIINEAEEFGCYYKHNNFIIKLLCL